MMHMMTGMMGSGFAWVNFLWMLMFWGVLIVGLVWVVNSIARSRPASGAEAILAERYARGELTREEYLGMKKDLR